MPIRYKLCFAFAVLAALACSLAYLGFRGVVTSGDLAVRLHDGPLIGVNHVRSAHAALNDARLLIGTHSGDGFDDHAADKFEKLIADIAEDLRIVRKRVQDHDVLAALTKAEAGIRDWSDAGLKGIEPLASGSTAVAEASLPIAQKGNHAAAALGELAEILAAHGFEYRMQSEASVAAAGTNMLALAIGTTLVALILAIGLAYSMNKPILAAIRVTERATAGDFSGQITSHRRDELGRLLRSLGVMQGYLKTRADRDGATLEKLDAALNSMSQGLCMFGPDDRLVHWNERYETMYRIAPGRLFAGCTLEQMLEARKEAGTAYRDRGPYDAKLRTAISSRATDNLIAELVDGRTVNVAYRPAQKGGWVSTHEDITERRRNEARIAHLAFHDQLTDLPNRAAFSDYIAKTLHSASTGNESFAVICIDLDRFKEINDVYGQSTGDRFLAEIGHRLTLACEGAFLARLGGDEFTVVSRGGAQPETAQALCGRLAATLSAPVRIDEYEIAASFTIGASEYPKDGTDVDTLVANAEAALHQAKAEQRGTIRFFEPAMGRQIREKRSLQHDIALAPEKNELELYFQPQATAAGVVFGFEALLRWRHPVRGMVSPALFIPLAEETGAIEAIDEWVLREACREAVSWSNPLSIAVNLSPVDFRRRDIPDMILSILLETGLNPKRLEIEITEGVLIDDFERAIAILRKVKNLGVRIAMDDFGTGYSSLSYLQSFPFDKIKIDQTFIGKIGDNFQATAIVHAILGLGRALTLPVIAEGVETEEQRVLLAREGCELQGYLIGRPQPIAHYQHLVTGFAGISEDTAIARYLA